MKKKSKISNLWKMKNSLDNKKSHFLEILNDKFDIYKLKREINTTTIDLLLIIIINDNVTYK